MAETRMELIGAKQLMADLKKFGPKVAKRAGNKGTRKAAMFLRREFKAAAPKRTGTLRRAIGFKYSVRSGRAWVGLRKTGADTKAFGSGAQIRYYYKTLEFGRAASKRAAGSPPMHKFFERTWERNKRRAASIMIKETQAAVIEEAAVEYFRSKARNR